MTATISSKAQSALLTEAKPFLAAIAADPTDTTTRAVFADWLQEHGIRLGDLLTRELKRAARSESNLSRTDSTPVEIDMDDTTDEAGVAGRSWYYTTESGREVRYPAAYKRVAKSAVLVYHGSSRRVQVGPKWIIARI